MRTLLYLAALTLLGCQTTDPTPQDAGTVVATQAQEVVEDAGTDACKPCDPAMCEGRCGSFQACGQWYSCGECASPYTCGAQDLQWYRPEPNTCGLGCRVVDVMSPRCKYPHPVEHACPTTDAFLAFVTKDDFWATYTCAPISASPTELHFCCGL